MIIAKLIQQKADEYGLDVKAEMVAKEYAPGYYKHYVFSGNMLSQFEALCRDPEIVKAGYVRDNICDKQACLVRA